MSSLPASGRALLIASGAVVLLGPLVVGAQLARLIPVDWLAWVPLGLAAAISWLVLAP